MALVNRAKPVEIESVRSFTCAYPNCCNSGSIAFTTHAGPETKWFCRFHAFPDDRKWMQDRAKIKEKMKSIASLSGGRRPSA